MVGIHYQAVLVMPALACTSVSVSAGIPPVLLVLLSAVVLADTPLHRPHYTADRSQSSEPPRPVPRVLWSVLEGCSIVGCLRVENVPVVADEWRMVQMQQGWTSERHRRQQQLGLNTSDNITSHSTVNVMDSAPIMCLLLLTCVYTCYIRRKLTNCLSFSTKTSSETLLALLAATVNTQALRTTVHR